MVCRAKETRAVADGRAARQEMIRHIFGDAVYRNRRFEGCRAVLRDDVHYNLGQASSADASVAAASSVVHSSCGSELGGASQTQCAASSWQRCT